MIISMTGYPLTKVKISYWQKASSGSTSWHYLYIIIEFLSLIVVYPTVLLTIYWLATVVNVKTKILLLNNFEASKLLSMPNPRGYHYNITWKASLLKMVSNKNKILYNDIK